MPALSPPSRRSLPPAALPTAATDSPATAPVPTPARVDATRRPTTRRGRGDAGQATTEYALILLAAALVGLLVIAWATAGGAAGRIGQLFDAVVDAVMSRL